jgi:hypothetical protein
MKLRRLAVVTAALALTVSVASPAAAQTKTGDDTERKIISTHWDSHRDFYRGSVDGLQPALGTGLRLPRVAKLPTLKYKDPFGSGGARSYEYGTWTSQTVQPGYAIDEAIVSWNAETPTGTWVEPAFRGKLPNGKWTKWYVMGRWTSGMDFKGGDIHRTSVDGQNDADGQVFTDTFSAISGKEPVAYQTRVRMLRPAGSHASPRVDSMTTMTNELLGAPGATSKFTLGRHVELKVPTYSQNVHAGEFPDFGGGGEVWCSPTSSSMVQDYWGHRVPQWELNKVDGLDKIKQDRQVDYAALHAWDYAYEGSGNWPFNAAYAHRFGLKTQITRLRSLAEAERFIKAGIPVITSLSWTKEEMPEAGWESTGHLMVLVGFTKDGDPIMNDPNGKTNKDVRRVYTRKNFEKVWLKSSGGNVYLYTPYWKHLPANVDGATKNW